MHWLCLADSSCSKPLATSLGSSPEKTVHCPSMNRLNYVYKSCNCGISQEHISSQGSRPANLTQLKIVKNL